MGGREKVKETEMDRGIMILQNSPVRFFYQIRGDEIV